MWDLTADEIIQKRVINGAMSDWINDLCLFSNHIYSAGRDGTITAWNADILSQVSRCSVNSMLFLMIRLTVEV